MGSRLFPLLAAATLWAGASCERSPAPPPTPQTAAASVPPASPIQAAPPAVDKTASPAAAAACPNRNPLKNVYFGDLHSHTWYSLDSFSGGNRNDPRDAYRFARGAELSVAAAAKDGGQKAKLKRPLDFLAVTDHSEFFDVMGLCVGQDNQPAPEESAPYCQGLRYQGSLLQKAQTLLALFRLSNDTPESPILCRGTETRRQRCADQSRATWQREQEYADAAYERCRFTTFKAYEWTGQHGKANIHRNVIFNGSHVPAVAFDFIHHPTAIDLWRSLEKDCRAEDGCDALTIPHNSNASFGQMWDTTDDPAAIPYMRRYQILTEIFQHKGSSECLPGDPLADPGCNFEVLSGSFLDQMFGGKKKSDSPPGGPGYVRAGLGRGLSYAALNKGQNPLTMGIIGSTDTHNGTPGNVEEQGWPGHVGALDNTPKVRLEKPSFNPAGLAGVWAEENTREAIFAALKRRETYATSGTRMAVRFYVVPKLTDDAAAQALCSDPDFPRGILAHGGVPMGGLFKPEGKPYLIVLAQKDETDLAQVDFIKLSSDAAGHTAASVKSLPIAAAAQKRACVAWQDSDFDPQKPTLYYARVLEQPTWRWSHYDCQALGADRPPDCDKELDVKIQERAWTSPVFAKPACAGDSPDGTCQ